MKPKIETRGSETVITFPSNWAGSAHLWAKANSQCGQWLKVLDDTGAICWQLRVRPAFNGVSITLPISVER